MVSSLDNKDNYVGCIVDGEVIENLIINITKQFQINMECTTFYQGNIGHGSDCWHSRLVEIAIDDAND